jgi:hypothetical protein
VAAVAFLSAPRRPDHHVLLTAVCLILFFCFFLPTKISVVATIKVVLILTNVNPCSRHVLHLISVERVPFLLK